MSTTRWYILLCLSYLGSLRWEEQRCWLFLISWSRSPFLHTFLQLLIDIQVHISVKTTIEMSVLRSSTRIRWISYLLDPLQIEEGKPRIIKHIFRIYETNQNNQNMKHFWIPREFNVLRNIQNKLYQLSNSKGDRYDLPCNLATPTTSTTRKKENYVPSRLNHQEPTRAPKEFHQTPEINEREHAMTKVSTSSWT